MGLGTILEFGQVTGVQSAVGPASTVASVPASTVAVVLPPDDPVPGIGSCVPVPELDDPPDPELELVGIEVPLDDGGLPPDGGAFAPGLPGVLLPQPAVIEPPNKATAQIAAMCLRA